VELNAYLRSGKSTEASQNVTRRKELPPTLHLNETLDGHWNVNVGIPAFNCCCCRVNASITKDVNVSIIKKKNY
jgi:hypothetical protein